MEHPAHQSTPITVKTPKPITNLPKYNFFMKHTEQFSVVYSIGGKSAYEKYSCGIRVEIDDNAEPSYNHSLLLNAIATAHNSFDVLVKAAGTINVDNVVINCIVRLTK